MDDKPNAPRKPTPKPPAASREDRLAAALRANLRRRKAPETGSKGEG